MLKIKDNTSKQELSYINATFWDNQKIKEILNILMGSDSNVED